MDGTRQRERTLGTALLVGIALVLLVIPVYDVISDVAAGKAVTTTLVENSFPALLAGVLLVGVGELRRRNWEGAELLRATRWTALALVVSAALMGVVLGLQRIQNDFKPYVIAGDAIIAAAVAGLAIGIYDVKSRRRREKLRIERNHLSALYENTKECIVTFDHEHGGPTVESANRAFDELFDEDVDTVLGEARLTDGHSDDHDLRATIYSRLRDRERDTWEIEVPVDDSMRVFLTRTVPTDNQHTYLVLTDITSQKRRERELERKTSEREAQLEKRTDQLKFLHSLLRHDVQNGTMVIRSRAKFIADKVDGRLEEYANTIVSRSDDISDQIDRMRTTLETLTSTDWSTEAIPLSDVLDDRVTALRSEHPEVQVSTSISSDLHVKADEMLEDVLDNVLRNAIKHNDKETPAIDVFATDGDPVRIEIADNGPGIPESRRDEVFRRGVTSASESGDSGSGFGLFFVDTMISAYGGDIWIEDNDPEGARVVIELDRASVESTDGDDENHREPDL